MTPDRPDAAATAALDAMRRRPVTFCFLDIAGGPIRVTNAPYRITFAGTGDEDLDGFTFDPVDSRVVSVGPIRAREGGTETVMLTLSGLRGLDSEMMDDLSDRARYQGRDARLWEAMLDPDDLTRVGGVWATYTGYMNVPTVRGDRTAQVIELSLESYLAFFGTASNRSYLDQQIYDPGDLSGELAVAIANGAALRQ